MKSFKHFTKEEIDELKEIFEVKREKYNEPIPTIPVRPAYAANLCPKCGITLENVMMYCCPHHDCPTGLGPIMCGVVG